jgi:hypothetical protein
LNQTYRFAAFSHPNQQAAKPRTKTLSWPSQGSSREQIEFAGEIGVAVVSPEQIAAAISSDLENSTQELFEAAVQAGSDDNITILLIRWVGKTTEREMGRWAYEIYPFAPIRRAEINTVFELPKGVTVQRLFAYLMTHDSGFAPNPFEGVLTLATCKPGIRRTKRPGDWVAGFASDALVRRSSELGVAIKPKGLVYLMRIAEVLPLEEYFDGPRFQRKKPSPEINKGGHLAKHYGDNIYYRDGVGEYRQLKNGNHGIDHKDSDTSGVNALVSDTFYYFGRLCPAPDSGWAESVKIPKGPSYYGYRNDETALTEILHYLHSCGHAPGMHGDPCLWGMQDKANCGSCSR